ncbi:hypothetical protein CRYUN_Cryun05aG0038200 [Craigia yunnanensis]
MKKSKTAVILKKQCSCSVRLTNNTNQYVAFKVKTTSPKKYCVRPNVGIIMPKSIYDFTVTMQAQREAPPDMICKDKFLIQSTVVPVTTDEDITSATVICQGRWKIVEENKLKVALVGPPNSPVLSPINGTMNQGTNYDASIPKEPILNRVGILAPLQTIAKVEESKMINFEDLKPNKDVELKPTNDVNGGDLKLTKDTELKPKNNFVNSKELKPVKDVELKPMEDILDIKELKSVKEKDFNALKDGEAEATISKLAEEKRLSTQERKILQEELALLRKKANLRRVQMRFPLLFVCMVALISVFLGYLLHH